MIQGSCLCKAVTFTITNNPVKVSHCHCIMCQKGHGAAFATYARFKRSDMAYQTGENELITYNSSEDVLRKFCGKCGSNIEWGCSERMPRWVAIAVASLDSPIDSTEMKNLHLESRANWLHSIPETSA